MSEGDTTAEEKITADKINEHLDNLEASFILPKQFTSSNFIIGGSKIDHENTVTIKAEWQKVGYVPIDEITFEERDDPFFTVINPADVKGKVWTVLHKTKHRTYGLGSLFVPEELHGFLEEPRVRVCGCCRDVITSEMLRDAWFLFTVKSAEI